MKLGSNSFLRQKNPNYPFKVLLILLPQAQRVHGASGVDKAVGTLLYSMASRLKDTKRVVFLAECIARRKLSTELQLAGDVTNVDRTMFN